MSARTFRNVVEVTVRAQSLDDAAQMLREAASQLQRGRVIGGDDCGTAGDYDFFTSFDVETDRRPGPPNTPARKR